MKNMEGSSIFVKSPRPNVVNVMSMNPATIVFLDPILFLTKAVIGANTSYATENITSMIVYLISENVYPSSLPIQSPSSFLLSMYFGKVA